MIVGPVYLIGLPKNYTGYLRLRGELWWVNNGELSNIIHRFDAQI